MIRRIFALIAVLLSILFLPYWLYVPMLLGAILIFPFFWEGIILALLIDVIHEGAIKTFGDIFTSFGFYTLLLLIILLPLRERLRYHA
ncbi:MAG: hypothetical protein WBL19_03290 [Minisyncoccia bacterium]